MLIWRDVAGRCRGFPAKISREPETARRREIERGEVLLSRARKRSERLFLAGDWVGGEKKQLIWVTWPSWLYSWGGAGAGEPDSRRGLERNILFYFFVLRYILWHRQRPKLLACLVTGSEGQNAAGILEENEVEIGTHSVRLTLQIIYSTEAVLHLSFYCAADPPLQGVTFQVIWFAVPRFLIIAMGYGHKVEKKRIFLCIY